MEKLSIEEIAILIQFLNEIDSNKKINPTNSLDMEAFSLGWFCSMGVNIEKAWEMATIARHTCGYTLDVNYFKGLLQKIKKNKL